MNIFNLNKHRLEINSNLCLHSKILNSSCQECINICPKNAWSLNENLLTFDEDKCEGCLLCASICPEGVISNDFKLKPINIQNEKTLFITCNNSLIENSELKISCVHSIGLKELLNFNLNGISSIHINIGECENCHNPKKTIFDNFEKISKLIDIKLFNLNEKEWEKELKKAKSFHKTSLTRRNFLKRFTAQTVDTTLKATNLIGEEKTFFTLADIVPKIELNTLPFVINIDDKKCNGCDICFKLCPHNALSIDRINSKYILNSKFCTGCNLCIDMCKEKAIEIDKFSNQRVNEIQLIEEVCSDCGVTFHTPKNFYNNSNKCQICQKTNHRSMLYQVMD